MGIPSCAIYATELARHYGVQRLIRIGTCGGVGDAAIGELLLAQSASTDSRFNRQEFGELDLSGLTRVATLDLETALVADAAETTTTS